MKGITFKINRPIYDMEERINSTQLKQIKISLKMVIQLRLDNQDEFVKKSPGHLYFISQLISGVTQIIESEKQKQNTTLKMLNVFTQVINNIVESKNIKQKFIDVVDQVVKDTRFTRQILTEYGLNDKEIEIVEFLSNQ